MSIRSEVEVKLAVFAAAQNPPIPIAYENVPFNPPVSGYFIEVKFLDNTTRNRQLSAVGGRMYGVFQVSCYGQLGVGMGKLEALSQSVIDLFPVIPKTGTVSIESPLDASIPMIVENFMCIPITARYRVEI